MTANGDDFCTAGKGVDEKHCGRMVGPRLSECAALTAVLIQKCIELPQQDATVQGFLRGIGLDTALVEGGDVYACYEKIHHRSKHCK
jgi:hypothetical protein